MLSEVIFIIAAVLSAGILLFLFFQKLARLKARAVFRVDSFKAILKEQADQAELNKEKQARLSTQVAGISLLYETIRDVSKTLDENEALGLLRVKLREFIGFDECVVFNEKDKSANEGLYYHLPLSIDNKSRVYLAIKNVNVKELSIEHLHIIANQFSLILRKIKLYSKVQELSIRDGLTQAFTRRYFLERFKEELDRSLRINKPLSVLMIDLDNFKQCNDKFGHLVGDIVLSRVTEEIKNSIRQVDLLGRVGGEEFCIVLPETDKPGAQLSAERIRKAVKESMIKAYDETIKATISLGVSTFPQDGGTATELIDRADWSLYRAKQSGRNKVCIYGIFKD